MARKTSLINDSELIGSLIRNNITNALVNFTHLFSSQPMFTRYYNRDVKTSTFDINLNANYKPIGQDSPLKFSRIKEFPIYGLQQVSQELSEGDFGPEAELNSTCFILPSTIVPFEDDFVAIPYVDTDGSTHYRLFRVTKVTKATSTNMSYFQLNISLEANNESDIEHQISNKFSYSVNDYQNNRKSIIDDDDFEALLIARYLREKVIDYYKQFFYSSSCNSFLYTDIDDYYLVNFYAHVFLLKSKALEFDRNGMNTLSYLNINRDRYFFESTSFKKTVYSLFLDYERLHQVNSETFFVETAENDKHSIFARLPERYKCLMLIPDRQYPLFKYSKDFLTGEETVFTFPYIPENNEALHIIDRNGEEVSGVVSLTNDGTNSTLTLSAPFSGRVIFFKEDVVNPDLPTTDTFTFNDQETGFLNRLKMGLLYTGDSHGFENVLIKAFNRELFDISYSELIEEMNELEELSDMSFRSFMFVPLMLATLRRFEENITDKTKVVA